MYKTLTKNKILYVEILILSALFIALYYHVIAGMIHDWEVNKNYSHGYLIPFIAGYMIWNIRKELLQIEISPNNWGALLILAGAGQLIVAWVGSEYFLQRTSIIVILFGITLFLAGSTFARKLSIPLLYLIFMIPIPAIIWNKFAFPMKLFASYIAVHVVNAIGISILREGNILHLASTTLEVADACSGIRSLTSLLALSAAFVFFVNLTKWKKLVLFLSAVPIAIFTNVLRLTITAALASRYGEKVARGFLHDFSGWLIFMLGLVMLIGVNVLLSRTKKDSDKERN